MNECPICYEDMPTPARLKCGHTFHKHCIDKWARQSATCPYCRRFFGHVPVPIERQRENVEMFLCMFFILLYTYLSILIALDVRPN